MQELKALQQASPRSTRRATLQALPRHWLWRACWVLSALATAQLVVRQPQVDTSLLELVRESQADEPGNASFATTAAASPSPSAAAAAMPLVAPSVLPTPAPTQSPTRRPTPRPTRVAIPVDFGNVPHKVLARPVERNRPLVINLGLPKTGTVSFSKQLIAVEGGVGPAHNAVAHQRCKSARHGAYETLFRGIRKNYFPSRCVREAWCAMHVYAAGLAGLRPFDLVRGYAIGQLDCLDHRVFYAPQITLLREMTTRYKPSEIIFVLTTRADPHWIRSVYKWGDMGPRIIETMGGLEIAGHTIPKLDPRKYREPEGTRWFTEFKQWHEQRVRNLTAGFRLIELDLEDPAGLEAGFADLVHAALPHEAQERFAAMQRNHSGYRWENRNTKYRPPAAA